MAAFLSFGEWFRGYRPEWLRPDIIAGLTTAAVAIPKALAVATIAGLPVETGLYVALVPMFVYTFFGTSRTLSVSSTSTIAILVASQLAMAVPDGDPEKMVTAASALALLTGAFLLLAGVLRLGFLANFISDPVLTGFKAGIGVVVVVDQIPKFLGFHIDKSGFFRDLWALLRHLPETSIPTLLLGAFLLVLLFGLERFLPRSPAPLIAVVVAITVSGMLGLKEAGVAAVGYIPRGIPLPSLPDLSLLKTLWPGAAGIALMSFTESVAAARTFARHDDPRPDPDRELFALGIANVAGSLFRAFPAGGGTSQTAVNAGAGARTQGAQVVTAATAAATLLVLAPLIALLPKTALAAVIIVSTLPLVSLGGFKAIARVRRTELYWAIITCAGVILVGTLEGILVAALVSILTLFYQANHPPLYIMGRKPGTGVFRPYTGEHPDDETIPGLLIVRTEGRMNFASAPRLRDRFWTFIDEAGPAVLVVECSAIPDFEYTALSILTGFEEKLRERGIVLWLAALNPEALRVVRRSPLGDTLGPKRLFHNLNDAVDAYEREYRTSEG